MLRPPSLLGQTSGFVPFGSGGSVHGDLDEAAPTTAPSTPRVASPAAADVAPAAAEPGVAWRQSAWAPAASSRVRFVEAAVLAAIGAYFSLGLLKLVGWL